MSKHFFFLGGLPRSGSTLLASILAQHPDIYTSPNSPLVNMLVNVNKHLSETEQARAFLQPSQKTDVLRGIMNGFYAFSDASFIIDKSRSWPHPHNIALLEELLGTQVKILATVRDLPSILASFLRLIRQHPQSVSFVDQALRDRRQLCTDENRAKFLFSPHGTVYEAWYTLHQAFVEGYHNRLCLIEYDELTQSPEQTLQTIYQFLGIPNYVHNISNIINTTPEDDSVYGIPGLHTVRRELIKTAPAAEEVLGHELYEQYAAVPHFWRCAPRSVNPLRITTLAKKKL